MIPISQPKLGPTSTPFTHLTHKCNSPNENSQFQSSNLYFQKALNSNLNNPPGNPSASSIFAKK